MSDTAWVFCGSSRLSVTRADDFAPPAHVTPVGDLERALGDAFSQPLGTRPLRALAHGAGTVAIAVPDSSRPCPSPAILRHLLEELSRAGIHAERVRVVIGCGLHATTSVTERQTLTGMDPDLVEVVDGQGIESPTADLGETSRGAPIRIARSITDADLVITVGVVEPHLYAGFSGGVKGVAIGCAGQPTIAWTHRPAFVSEPGVALGRLEGNPFAETIAEVAARTSLRWAVNAVMTEHGQAATVAAGDPALVQSSLAAAHAPAWFRHVEEPCDVLVAGVHTPKSDNFYQASRAATYVGLAARPALADGGLLVLCAELPDGPGQGPGERNFLSVLAAAASAAEVIARGLREPLGPGGQRSFVLARVLERFRLGVVGAHDPAFLAPLERLGVTTFDSVDAAVASAEVRLGRRARVLAVADAMATVVTRFRDQN